MTSFYHGSCVRYAIGGLGLRLGRVTKAVRKLFGARGRASAPAPAQQTEIDALIQRRDWSGLAVRIDEMAVLAKDTAKRSSDAEGGPSL